jgi:hypothetical protein
MVRDMAVRPFAVSVTPRGGGELRVAALTPARPYRDAARHVNERSAWSGAKVPELTGFVDAQYDAGTMRERRRQDLLRGAGS